MKERLVIAFYADYTPLLFWGLHRWNMRTPHPWSGGAFPSGAADDGDRAGRATGDPAGRARS